MKTNDWVASSQRFYRWLLRLYPQAYRESYEEEMFHLFTDQCREADQQPQRLVLWFRTLTDVAVSVIHEHLSDPHARDGLLEAAPNAPLPWKGVLLVLIPGLIFFVSQVEQVTSNNDWFFLAFHRAGYFLILPVLLVWLLTRKFPVWGLIPLGLLYKTLWNYFERFDLLSLPFRSLARWFSQGAVIRFGVRVDAYLLKYLLGMSLSLILLLSLIWYCSRSGWMSRSAWRWLGFCGLLIVLQVSVDTYGNVVWLSQNHVNTPSNSQVYLLPEMLAEVRGEVLRVLLLDLYQSLPFLVLIFIGLLFARKYGGFSFLLLLGYLLPTIVFGRYGEWNAPIAFYLVTLAVLLYRFVVALVAPIWLVRAASLKGRQRAAVIPVAVAIACHAIFNLTVSIAWTNQFVYGRDLFTAVTLIWNVWGPLMIAIGLGLALALYLPREMEQTVVPPPALLTAAE